MGGRETDDDDTHERHTDTNRLTRHTASPRLGGARVASRELLLCGKRGLSGALFSLIQLNVAE